MHASIERERTIVGDNSYLQRFGELFIIPRIRRATLASFVVMIAQQMCGTLLATRLPSLFVVVSLHSSLSRLFYFVVASLLLKDPASLVLFT